ncbi:hypothetical protein TgHK011_008920 [Trichoderma gracile]|nr:hypothetical protein TgHK011_008920 [Trichoderma gracile]
MSLIHASRSLSEAIDMIRHLDLNPQSKASSAALQWPVPVFSGNTCAKSSYRSDTTVRANVSQAGLRSNLK